MEKIGVRFVEGIIGNPKNGIYYKVISGKMPFVRTRYTTAEAHAAHGYRPYEDCASEVPVPAVKVRSMVHKSLIPKRFRAEADKDGFVCEEEIVFLVNGFPETESEILTLCATSPYAEGKDMASFKEDNL